MPIMKCKDCGSKHYINNESLPVVKQAMDIHKCTICGGKTHEASKEETSAWAHEVALDAKNQQGSTMDPRDLRITDDDIEKIRKGLK